MSKKRSSVDEDILARFACTGCGVCCRWPGHVLLTDTDIRELAYHLALGEADFIEQYTRLASNRAQLSLKDQADGSCILLDGNTCGVYEARPLQCRSFPAAWQVRQGCPELDRLHDEKKRVE